MCAADPIDYHIISINHWHIHREIVVFKWREEKGAERGDGGGVEREVEGDVRYHWWYAVPSSFIFIMDG